MVTDQFVKTIYVASTEIRWRRKSKIVHAKRPDQIPPRPFHASTTNLPFAERRGRVRSTQGMPEIHHPRHSADYPVIPASPPSFPRTREPRKNKARRQTSPSPREGDACAARRGCPKTHQHPVIPSKLPEHPRQPLHHPPTPSIIPASLTPSFPRAIRHSRKPYPVIPADAGTQRKTKHTAKPPLRGAKGTRAQHAGDARKPPTPPLRSSEHQDNPSIIPPPPPSSPHPLRHSREPSVIPASHPSFPRTREPREKQSTPPNLPFAERRGRVRSTQGMPENHQHPPFEAPNTKTTPPSSPHPLRHSREPSVIPADYPVIPADAGTQRKTKHAAKPPLRGAKGTRAQHAGDARKPPTPPLRSSEHQDKASHHSHHSNHINHSSDDCASSQPFARISLTGRAEWHIFGII